MRWREISKNHNSKRKKKEGFCKGKVEKFMDTRYVPCSHEYQAFLWIPYSVNTSMKMNRLFSLRFSISQKKNQTHKSFGDETKWGLNILIFTGTGLEWWEKIKCFNIDDNDLRHQVRLNVVNTLLHTKTSPKFWGATMKWCI